MSLCLGWWYALTAATSGTLKLRLEPLLHVLSVTPMTAVDAEVGGTLHRNSTHRTDERVLLADTAEHIMTEPFVGGAPLGRAQSGEWQVVQWLVFAQQLWLNGLQEEGSLLDELPPVENIGVYLLVVVILQHVVRVQNAERKRWEKWIRSFRHYVSVHKPITFDFIILLFGVAAVV